MSFHETTSTKCHWYLVRLWFLVLLWEFSSCIVLRIWEYHSLLVILRSSWYSKLVYKFGPLSFFSSLDCVQDGPMAACSPAKWQNTWWSQLKERPCNSFIKKGVLQFSCFSGSIYDFESICFYLWNWLFFLAVYFYHLCPSKDGHEISFAIVYMLIHSLRNIHSLFLIFLHLLPSNYTIFPCRHVGSDYFIVDRLIELFFIVRCFIGYVSHMYALISKCDMANLWATISVVIINIF